MPYAKEINVLKFWLTTSKRRPRIPNMELCVELADVENALHIHFSLIAQLQDGFIASPLTLFDQASPNPPHCRMMFFTGRTMRVSRLWSR
jgi:hypothetical protein